MSINISSANVLQNLYNNNRNGKSYYVGLAKESNVRENKTVTASLSSNSNIRHAIRALSEYDYDSGLRSDVKKNIEKLVKEYNTYVDNSGNDSKKYKSELNKLKKTFEEHSSELSKIGITIKKDKLSFDSEKFSDADMKDLEKVFKKGSEFSESVGKSLKNLSKTVAGDTQYVEVQDKFISNTVSAANIKSADIVNSMIMSVGKMLKTPYDGENQDEILGMLEDYINGVKQFYNEVNTNSGIEYSSKAISDINRINTLNIDFINEINSGNIEYNEDFDSNNDNSYGSTVDRLYKDLFSELVNAKNKDFNVSSFVDYKA